MNRDLASVAWPAAGHFVQVAGAMRSPLRHSSRLSVRECDLIVPQAPGTRVPGTKNKLPAFTLHAVMCGIHWVLVRVCRWQPGPTHGNRFPPMPTTSHT